MTTITAADGHTVEPCWRAVIVIQDDLHTERAGRFRAFWATSPDASTGSPVIGYASPGAAA